MKIKLALITIAAMVFLSACGSAPSKPAPAPVAPPVPDCVFPNTEVAAPGWICSEPVPGVDVSAVGSAEKSAAGMSFMRDQATLDARGQLAEQMKTKVSKMVKSYIGTTGKGDAETVDAAASSTARSIASADLVGSKIYKTRTGPNGMLYVLVGMTEADTQRIAKQAVKTSMGKDQALWQQFKSKKSFDEMAAELAKQN